MKRYKKKEMLQITATLLKANRTIIKALEQRAEGLQDVYAQCQESAIMLGTAVEEQYAEGCPETVRSLVELLERYCEIVYQMSIQGTDTGMCRKLSKSIQKLLTRAEHEIRYELPGDRIEAVFLPYKASMWDSLEIGRASCRERV